MSVILTTRCHRLADSLAELKVKVRAVLATELAGAVGTAVRDVLVVALVDRLVVPGPQALVRPSVPRVPSWRDDGNEPPQDEWGYPRDPWDEPDGDRARSPSRYVRDESEGGEPVTAVPAAAAVAVGVNVGRWWLARKGSIAAAVGLGVLATALGLAGGPVARAALAVLAVASDLLAAESALARLDRS